MSAGESIRELALPVVMISANGLICLALYNRLAAITSRFRGFTRERFEIRSRLLEVNAAHSPELVAQLKSRLAAIAQDLHTARRRAKGIRNALVFLLLAVICMLVTSLLLGLIQEVPLPPSVPLSMFVAGIGLMICGVAMAVWELVRFLEVIQIHDADQSEPAPLIPGGGDH